MAHAYCMLTNYGYKHTIRICNIYCFSTATMVTRTHHNVTLHYITPPVLLRILYTLGGRRHSNYTTLVMWKHKPEMDMHAHIKCPLRLYVGPVAQSVYRLTTGWTVRGSNPGGGEIFRTRPDQPCGPPTLLYNGYRVFPGGKAAEAWCWPPTEVENEYSTTSTPL
jgi:hypothetical protein